MRLVDTSVWIAFLRGKASAAPLGGLLESGEVLVHPWIIGELALGNLGRSRGALLADLARLPASPVVGDAEVMALIEAHHLSGRGIGWVDAQLLASARKVSATLWSEDSRLALAAEALRL